jgi:hypothetical protein
MMVFTIGNCTRFPQNKLEASGWKLGPKKGPKN